MKLIKNRSDLIILMGAVIVAMAGGFSIGLKLLTGHALLGTSLIYAFLITVAAFFILAGTGWLIARAGLTTPQSTPEYAVWWLTQANYRGFQPESGPNPLKVPDYVWKEFCSRHNRPGRGRLWIPSHIKTLGIKAEPNDPRWESYLEAGGIVIEYKDIPACATWGGRFTDLKLSPIRNTT